MLRRGYHLSCHAHACTYLHTFIHPATTCQAHTHTHKKWKHICTHTHNNERKSDQQQGGRSGARRKERPNPETSASLAAKTLCARRAEEALRLGTLLLHLQCSTPPAIHKTTRGGRERRGSVVLGIEECSQNALILRTNQKR